MFTKYCVNNFMMYISQIIMLYTSNSNNIPVNKTGKKNKTRKKKRGPLVGLIVKGVSRT